MIRRATFLALAAMALFAVQGADCASPLAANQHSMPCCGSMPCHPSHGFHECCKTKVSSQSPTILSRGHADLSLSCASAAAYLSAGDIAPADAARSEFAAPQHSPPELFTLYSLRI